MIAPWQPIDARLRDRASKEVGVRRRCGCIVEAVIDVHGTVEPHCDLTWRLKVVSAPATFTDERRRHQEERAELPLRRLRREDVDHYRTADRVTYEDGVVIERRELSLERRFPFVVPRVALVRHPWILDLVVRPELALETSDELVVP